MQAQLENTIDVWEEMVAYETLWALPKQTLKSISEMFHKQPVLPSELLSQYSREKLFDTVRNLKEDVEDYLKHFNGFSVCVNGTFQYPERLHHAKYPIELFYYRGDIGLLESPSVSIVGARKCSEDGARRAKKLSRTLVQNNYTVVSGLARGIDTFALEEAIREGGNAVGVIGTPINRYYPRENQKLQDKLAEEKLLISQVPFYIYEKEPFSAKKLHFPQRNVTMAALSEATIIVEASDTSGALTQARACLQQGLKLFILDSCFNNQHIRWPQSFEKRGAIRVKDVEDIVSNLESAGG
jgi:DNA processing protein